MNNFEIVLHDFQKTLLKKLTKNEKMRFNELLIDGLESEHMNYHLKRLVDLGFVEKSNEYYQLTDEGKEYSNLMDDKVEFVEKQPKTSVLLNIVRKNNEGKVEHLLSKRLRQPYLGKMGKLTGKVRFGEKLEEAAARELYEETGLVAKEIVLEKVYHKLRHRENGNCVQDVIFYQYFVRDLEGHFIEKTESQENVWVSVEDSLKTDFNGFDDLKLTENYAPCNLKFTESDGNADGY